MTNDDDWWHEVIDVFFIKIKLSSKKRKNVLIQLQFLRVLVSTSLILILHLQPKHERATIFYYFLSLNSCYLQVLYVCAAAKSRGLSDFQNFDKETWSAREKSALSYILSHAASKQNGKLEKRCNAYISNFSPHY